MFLNRLYFCRCRVDSSLRIVGIETDPESGWAVNAEMNASGNEVKLTAFFRGEMSLNKT